MLVERKAIDQFKYSHFVCLPVYHNTLILCRGDLLGRGRGVTQLRGGGGGLNPGVPPSVSNPDQPHELVQVIGAAINDVSNNQLDH